MRLSSAHHNLFFMSKETSISAKWFQASITNDFILSPAPSTHPPQSILGNNLAHLSLFTHWNPEIYNIFKVIKMFLLKNRFKYDLSDEYSKRDTRRSNICFSFIDLSGYIKNQTSSHKVTTRRLRIDVLEHYITFYASFTVFILCLLNHSNFWLSFNILPLPL